LAGQWLNDEDCSGNPNCADLYVDNVVNMLDFTLLAENWLEDYSEITLVINEFMAKNDGFIQDERGVYEKNLVLFAERDSCDETNDKMAIVTDFHNFVLRTW